MSKVVRISTLFTILTAIAAISLGLPLSGCSSSSASETAVVGAKAPDFNLPDLNGSTVSLSNLEGSPVLINFWYTGCPPCRNEMPYLQQVHSENEEAGLIVLAINAGENSSTIVEFLDNNELSSLLDTILVDSKGDTFQKYGIQYFPTTYFIDRNGIIKEKVIGAFPSKESIDKRLEQILP